MFLELFAFVLGKQSVICYPCFLSFPFPISLSLVSITFCTWETSLSIINLKKDSANFSGRIGTFLQGSHVNPNDNLVKATKL